MRPEAGVDHRNDAVRSRRALPSRNHIDPDCRLMVVPLLAETGIVGLLDTHDRIGFGVFDVRILRDALGNGADFLFTARRIKNQNLRIAWAEAASDWGDARAWAFWRYFTIRRLVCAGAAGGACASGVPGFGSIAESRSG